MINILVFITEGNGKSLKCFKRGLGVEGSWKVRKKGDDSRNEIGLCAWNYSIDPEILYKFEATICSSWSKGNIFIFLPDTALCRNSKWLRTGLECFEFWIKISCTAFMKFTWRDSGRHHKEWVCHPVEKMELSLEISWCSKTPCVWRNCDRRKQRGFKCLHPKESHKGSWSAWLIQAVTLVQVALAEAHFLNMVQRQALSHFCFFASAKLSSLSLQAWHGLFPPAPVGPLAVGMTRPLFAGAVRKVCAGVWPTAPLASVLYTGNPFIHTERVM